MLSDTKLHSHFQCSSLIFLVTFAAFLFKLGFSNYASMFLFRLGVVFERFFRLMRGQSWMVVHREEFDGMSCLIFCEDICRDYELLNITRFSLLLLRDCVFCGMTK